MHNSLTADFPIIRIFGVNKDLKFVKNFLDKAFVIFATTTMIILAPSAKHFMDKIVVICNNNVFETANPISLKDLPKAKLSAKLSSTFISLQYDRINSEVLNDATYQSYIDRHSIISVDVETETTSAIPEWFEYDLARIIQAEGGILDDTAQQLIGYVFLNRMSSPYFPDTFDGVFNDGDAYHPNTHEFFELKKTPSDQALANAKVCLENYYNNTIPVPDCLVYQAEFNQGAGLYQSIGKMKFCLDSRLGYKDDYQNFLIK